MERELRCIRRGKLDGSHSTEGEEGEHGKEGVDSGMESKGVGRGEERIYSSSRYIGAGRGTGNGK